MYVPKRLDLHSGSATIAVIMHGIATETGVAATQHFVMIKMLV